MINDPQKKCHPVISNPNESLAHLKMALTNYKKVKNIVNKKQKIMKKSMKISTVILRDDFLYKFNI